MARKSRQEVMMRKWWVRALVALAFLGVAYGFASLAIDSGSWLEYALTIGLIWWAVHHAIRSVRYMFSHQ